MTFLENKLLLISINFTPKNSHSCLKKKVLSLFSKYYNPCITGGKNPLYNPTNQGEMDGSSLQDSKCFHPPGDVKEILQDVHW